MLTDRIKKILNEVKVSVENPEFCPRLFSLVVSERKREFAKVADNFKRIAAEEYDELTQLLDESQIQDSASVRNNLKTRRLASLLINDDGDLKTAVLSKVIKLIQSYMYSLGPNRHDAKRQEHLLNVLISLKENKKLVRALKRISKPHAHRYAEQIIRDTLRLSPNTVITDAHARRAVLAAWMCYLRQSVGSCFATAPAIIVQQEQPEQFLNDMQEMLNTGRLKRTFAGVEYAVPLCHSWGAGDLKRMFVLPVGHLSEQTRIWRSPGLMTAFESVGLIESEISLSEKLKRCKQLVVNLLTSWESERSYVLVDIEQVLRRILLQHFELTEQDIEEYQNRPKGLMTGGLMAAVPFSTRGKGKACKDFLNQFEVAQNAFKALADNALLRSWEFTLASFAETKAQFTTWNLYSSLGIGPEEKGGIGYHLYRILKQRVEECNEKVRELQVQYEEAYHHLQYLQARIKSVSSEEQARWVRSEYQAKANEFRTLQEMRDTAQYKAQRYANLFDGLVDLYFQLFPKYFQEVYDPDMHEVSVGPYDDQPAGFRLLYKHGRSNTSLWTLIYNHYEYIDALASFFIATETEIAGMPLLEGLKDDLTEIVTTIVSHVRTKEFIESAFYRMAVAHKGRMVENPLENLDKIEKKPWVYTSGGAMHTLVSTYFRREEKPTEVERWVENPMELLVFFIDSIKQVPDKILDEYIANPNKSMLVHSPTHAFLLKPGLPWFRQAWETNVFTYTWVRDYVVRPMERFCAEMFLDGDKMQFIIQALLEKIPENFKKNFEKTFGSMRGSMLVRNFREYILETTGRDRGLRYPGADILSPDDLDGVLFSLLPLFPSYQLHERVEAIIDKLPDITKEMREQILEALDKAYGRAGVSQIISAKGLQDIVKGLISLVTQKTTSTHDSHKRISQIAQELGYAIPTPFIFADTNWVKDEFAFLVNPGTQKFELWRVDYTGSVGSPMHIWEEWLNGSRKHPTWGIFTRPYEYKL